MSENSNAQIQPETPPTPPASTGPTVDELKAELEKIKAESERTREGLIRDLQKERATRQEYEARISSPAPSPVSQQDVNDELAKVLNPYIAPLKQQLEALQAKSAEDKALEYLSGKTGKKPADILSDTALQEKLVATAKKWQLVGSVDSITQRAYELMELEDMKVKEVERARASQVAQNASLPSGAPPAPATATREYSVDDFNRMNTREFDALSSKGDFRKVGDKFVYTPRS